VTSSRFECRAVTKTYDDCQALAEVCFTVTAGEHAVILGTSGCGKSTALRLLAGLEAPSKGQVLLDGRVVSEPGRILRPPHLRGVAMVFQDLALWPNLSALDNVLLGLSGTELSKDERQRRAGEALALCRIDALSDRKPGSISGGQQQRVALARAIAVRPTFLFLDEPFSGLDLVTKSRMLEEISVLVNHEDLTVLLVTHDPTEATTLCTSAIVLDEGRVVESGRLEDLLPDPRSEMLKVFRDHGRC